MDILWIYTTCLLLTVKLSRSELDESWRCRTSNGERRAYTYPFNGNCYQFVNKEAYWTNARDYCRDRGGRLASIKDSRTNDFIVDRLDSLTHWDNSGVWIGLHDRYDELNWKWSTESRNKDESIQFENWARGHPAAFLHSLRDCVRMVRDSNWKWHETLCSAMKWKYNFICQYAMLPLTTTESPPVFEQHVQREWAGVQHATPPSEGSESRKHTQDRQSTTQTLQQHENEIVVPMELAQKDGESKQNNFIIFGLSATLTGMLAFIILLLFVIIRRRRKNKQTDYITEVSLQGNIENPTYGATSCEENPVCGATGSVNESDTACKKGVDSRPSCDRHVMSNNRVMNIYTNPSDNLQVGPSEEVTLPSGGIQMKHDNEHNQMLLEGNEYLEPQKCGPTRLPELPANMANRALPEIHHQGSISPLATEARKGPKHFRRQPIVNKSDSMKEDDVNDIKDQVDCEENLYNEIPEVEENVYASLDDVKDEVKQLV